MLIMKLDYVFISLLLLFCFVQGRVKNFIFYIFLSILVGLTPLHSDKKHTENEQTSFG